MEQQLTEEISDLDQWCQPGQNGWGERVVHSVGTNREFMTEEDQSIPQRHSASSGAEQCGRR